MDWAVNGFLTREVTLETKGQVGWLVEGWTTASGGGATASAAVFRPILMSF